MHAASPGFLAVWGASIPGAAAATKWKDQGQECRERVSGTCMTDWGVGEVVCVTGLMP